MEFKQKLNQEVENYESQLIDLTLKLIEMDTIRKDGNKKNPYGHEMSRAIKEVCQFATDSGLDHVKIYDNKFATIDLLSQEKNARNMMIMNHLDVVEYGEGWTKNPKGEIEDEFIYGRGSTDNKGPLAASLLSLIIINKLKIPLKNNIRLFIGLDEEHDFGCINHYKSLKLRTPDFGITPDAKFPIVDREFGIVNFTLEKKLSELEEITITSSTSHNIIPDNISVKQNCCVKQYDGVATHSATPERGVNAIHKMISKERLVFANPELNSLFKSLNKDIVDNRIISTLNGIAFEYTITSLNLKNDNLRITIDSRFDEKLKGKDVFKYIMRRYSLLSDDLKTVKIEDGYYRKDSVLKQLLIDNYNKFRPHDKVEPITLKGTTYAKTFKNIFPYGISFLDSPKSFAHGADERISKEKLFEGFKILANGIYEVGITEIELGEIE